MLFHFVNKINAQLRYVLQMGYSGNDGRPDHWIYPMVWSHSSWGSLG